MINLLRLRILILILSNLVLALCMPYNTAFAEDISSYFYKRPTFIDLSVGTASACAVSGDFEVWCWGANSNFQTAAKKSKFESTPNKVNGIPEVLRVSVGESHVCALLKIGRVVCWGSNANGQLGTSFTAQDLPESPIPQYVNGVTNVESIFSGSKHSCALDTSKRLFCWGSNKDGQLGQYSADNTEGHSGKNVVPQAEPLDIRDVVDVALGESHSCAVTIGGFVYCWGSNFYGQLGVGWNVKSSVQPRLVGSLTDVIEIDASKNSTCALQKGGILRCWGAGDNGQLGTGELVDLSIPSSSSMAFSQQFISRFSVGFRSTCVVQPKNGISCWGSTSFGQAGSLVPFNSIVGIGENAILLDSGENFSCSLSQNINCWGANDLGQLGRMTNSSAGGFNQINNPRWDLGNSAILHSQSGNVISIRWPAVGSAQTYARVESAPGKLLCQTTLQYFCEFSIEDRGRYRITLYLFVNDANGKNQGLRAEYEFSVESAMSEAQKRKIDEDLKKSEEQNKLLNEALREKKLQELIEKFKKAEVELALAEKESNRLNDILSEMLDHLAEAKDRQSAAGAILTEAIKLQSENLLLLKKITKQLSLLS